MKTNALAMRDVKVELWLPILSSEKTLPPGVQKCQRQARGFQCSIKLRRRPDIYYDAEKFVQFF